MSGKQILIGGMCSFVICLFVGLVVKPFSRQPVEVTPPSRRELAQRAAEIQTTASRRRQTDRLVEFIVGERTVSKFTLEGHDYWNLNSSQNSLVHSESCPCKRPKEGQ